MKTDKHLYVLFKANPEWIFELTGLQSPGECEWQSVSLKALELTSDGVIFPKNPNEALTVVEFQFQDDATVYCRTAQEMLLLQQQYDMRGVQGIIFFRQAHQDPQTEPWRQIIRSYLLRDVLEALAHQDANHPLVAVFQPVLLTNEETLEKNAAKYYNQIKTSNLTEPVKQTVLDVFVNWLEHRFKTMSKADIEKMLFGELADLRETQSGKDLIKIGKDEGVIEGQQEALIQILEAKFGTLVPDIRQRIEQTNDINKLKELLLQVLKADTIEQISW